MGERDRLREKKTDRQINKDTKRQTLTDKQTETVSIKVNDFKNMINKKKI